MVLYDYPRKLSKAYTNKMDKYENLEKDLLLVIGTLVDTKYNILRILQDLKVLDTHKKRILN